jgi:hypothetical protein
MCSTNVAHLVLESKRQQGNLKSATVFVGGSICGGYKRESSQLARLTAASLSLGSVKEEARRPTGRDSAGYYYSK